MIRRDDRYSGRPGSSSRWGLWKRMTLRRADGVVYLHRLRIVQTPWFGLYLHRMDAPDPGTDLHDHPWPFATVVLRGGYKEWRAPTRCAQTWAAFADGFNTCTPGVVEVRRPFRPRRMRLDECHSIFGLLRAPTWTLVAVGRRVRNWGFYIPEGFVQHEAYRSLGRREVIVQEDGNVTHYG